MSDHPAPSRIQRSIVEATEVGWAALVAEGCLELETSQPDTEDAQAPVERLDLVV